MPEILKLILNFLLLLCLVACSGRSDVTHLLNEVEMCMNEKPDSALYLLDSILQPKDLSREQNALWCLLHTQAQDKNRIEHTSDSLIQIAVNYFEKTDLEDRKMQAYYYCGSVFQDLNDAPQAQEYYLKAYEVGQSLNQYSLLGRLCANLGTLYTYQELYQPAMDFQKEAIGYFLQDKDTVSLSVTLRNIARIHVCENRLDSAMNYYLKALAYTSDSHRFYMLNELADTYGQAGDYDKGLSYARKAYSHIETVDDSCLVSLTLGDLYFNKGENDSAYAYLSFCEKSSNIQTLSAAYYSLAQLEKLKKNLNGYVVFQEKYENLREAIDEVTHTEMLYRQQGMYDYQLVEKEKEYFRQTSYKRTQSLYWVSLIGILLLVLVVSVFIYKNSKKQKKEEQLNQALRLEEQKYKNSQQYLKDREFSVNRLKKQLESELLKRTNVEEMLKKQLESEQQKMKSIEIELKNQSNLERQKRVQIENELLNELKLVQQDKAELGNKLELMLKMIDKNKNRRTKERNIDVEKEKSLFFASDLYHGIYSEWTKIDNEQWTDLIDWIDHLLYVDFTYRVKDLYPGISEIELKICYLIKLSVSVGRIATLLSVSSQAISVNKKRLYTKLTGKRGSAKEFDKFISQL